MATLELKNVSKYYKGLEHQKVAVQYLGEILLNTPAKERLGLSKPLDFLKLSGGDLEWLQRQIENTKTFANFTKMWRNNNLVPERGKKEKIFSQRDNSILPLVTCASSASAAYVDYQLRAKGKDGLTTDEGYLRRVFSGRYGSYGRNNSVSWDIQTKVINSYGIRSKYIWDGNLSNLKKEVIKNGCSVINIYHKGTRRSNRRGGHVLLATEFTNTGVVVHDPYGERPPSYSLTNVGASQFNNMTQNDEYDLLKRLVLCEARGEGVLGMAIVARVVLNRVRLTEKRLENFNTRNGTINGIVFAKGQFEPTWSRNNNLSDIYDRVNYRDKRNAAEAIRMAQDIPLLESKLVAEGLGSNAKEITRATFFAATSHPQAIRPYINNMYTVGNQVIGEGKNTTKVSESTLFNKFDFKEAKRTASEDLVGVYEFSYDEFAWRWQGNARYLLD